METFEMTPLVGLLLIALGAAALIGAFVGLERWLRRPGLTFLLVAVSLIVVAGAGLLDGKRLLPMLFLLQVPGFLYFANLRRTAARAGSAGASEA